MANIVKSIGTAAGRDFATIPAWWASIPADVVAAGNNYIGQVYKDSELIVTTGITLSGKTTNASNTITLEAAPGNAFYNAADFATTPLKYNAARGAAIRTATRYITLFTINNSNLTIRGLQFANSDIDAKVYENVGTGTGVLVENCIFQMSTAGDLLGRHRTGVLRNSVILCLGGGSAINVDYPTASCVIENCTFMRPSNLAAGGSALGTFGPGAYLRNNAIFGFNSVGDATNYTGQNNASDKVIPFGTNNLSSLVYADQFEGTTFVSHDLRLKLSSVLINAGAPTQASNTTGLNGARSINGAPDIGAWEMPVFPASALVISGPTAGTVGFDFDLIVGTDYPLTTGQSKPITMSENAGGLLTPASFTLTPETPTQTVEYIPQSLGAKIISAASTGTPAMATKTYSFTATAPQQATTLEVFGPGTVTIGEANTLTVTTDQLLGEGESLTVSLTDNAGGTFGGLTIPLSKTTRELTVAYTPAGATGTRTVVASATGTPAVSNDTFVTTTALPAPKLVQGMNFYEIGAGKQFATQTAFETFINGKNLVTLDANVTVDLYDSITVGATKVDPICDPTHRVLYRAAASQSYRTLDATPYDAYPSVGVQITFNSGEYLWQRGVILENLRLYFPNTATMRMGLGQGSVDCFMNNCRIKSDNPGTAHSIVSGHGFCNIVGRNNIITRTAGSGAVINFGDGRSDWMHNIHRTEGTATGNCGVLYGQYGFPSKVQNNVFIACGSVPIDGPYVEVGTEYKNNLSNVAVDGTKTQMIKGLTTNTGTYFQASPTDMRPANPGPLFGTGSLLAKATLDSLGNNRGASPDIGPYQLVPATPLPVFTIVSQDLQGQTIVYTATTQNTPTSATVTIPPGSPANGAVSQSGVTVVLGSGTATASKLIKQAGKYAAPVSSSSNAGGSQAGTGGTGFELLEISGTPEIGVTAQTNPIKVTGVTITPTSATDSVDFNATVQGENNPGQTVTWTTTIGTVTQDGGFTRPALTSSSQSGVVRATSDQDPSYFSTATITLPAATVPNTPPPVQTRTVALPLTTDGSTPVPNMSGLKYAWWDQASPANFSAPLLKGSNGAFANGVFSLSLPGSALVAGGTGCLLITNGNGSADENPAPSVFFGPVKVN